MSQSSPPVAKKHVETIEQHGVNREDAYTWMRDENWQKVLQDPSILKSDIRDHLRAEVAYYDDQTKELDALRKTLIAEMRGRLKEDDSSVPVCDGPYAYGSRFETGGEYPLFIRTARDGGEEKILYHGPDECGGSKFFSIGSIEYSPDHKLLAIGTDRLGSEYYELEVRNIETGERVGDVIPNTDGAAVWTAASDAFFYIERDENQRPKRVKLHKVGAPVSADMVVYEEEDDANFLSIAKTLSGDYIEIISGDQVTNVSYIIPASAPETAPLLFSPRVENETYSIEHRGDWFYLLTNCDGAVDYKIMRTPVTATSKENWEEVLAHRPGIYVSAMTVYRSFMVRSERADAKPRIVITDLTGAESEIAFDQSAYSVFYSDGAEFDTRSVRVYYQSPSQPAQTFDVDMASGEKTLRKTQEVPSGHDPDRYVVERINAIASDGEQVPVVILRLRETPLDGTAPLLLYGYGSYGIYIDNSFSTGALSLVDRGMIYAIAHIRGGSAKGRQWYLDGKLDKKKNSFTDFISAAETLIEKNFTSKKKIVCMGGSAGGLLVGAAVNLRPDLFAAVLALVPFVDVLNTISDAELPLTPPEWTEWGNPINDKDAFDYIASYSPYDNIQAGAEYPPILATGGLTDYRVTYWEMAKWIARLRDEAAGGPFLLRMNMDAGHGGSAARFEALEERAHLYAYALSLTGLAK